MTVVVVPQTLGLTLTGNVLVDNGLAAIAALAVCRRIEDLTIDRVHEAHQDGIKLATNNMRLRSNSMIFTNSITTQPSYSYDKKVELYKKITTALIDAIGYETKPLYCDYCTSPRSVDLARIVRSIGIKDKVECHIGRGWIPLSGSMKSDAQALPGASRGLNCCAKCLLAIQYLPLTSILVYGKLALFQATSIELWYSWIRRLVVDISNRLAAPGDAKIETIGKDAGSREASERLLAVVGDMRDEDYTADQDEHMIMYCFTNAGADPQIKKEFIPGFALNFLHDTQREGLGDDAMHLIARENKKTRYEYSFLKCISTRRDYLSLYPSGKWLGATPGLYRLYQRDILGHKDSVIYTAFRIADYVKTETSDGLEAIKIAANLEKGTGRRNRNRIIGRVMEMVDKELITFNAYYDLFIRGPTDRRNPWMLIKYYLLNDRPVELFDIVAVVADADTDVYNQDYRDRVIKAGTTIFDWYLGEYGPTRLKRLLTKFAARKITPKQLRSWFTNAELDYDNKELDYQMIELFRVLFIEKSISI